MYIIISGMNNLTFSLARKFISQGDEVSFIGADEAEAKKVEKTLGFITILGNSSNNQTQLEAGIERAQYFISADLDDGINLIGAQVAKSLNQDIKTIILLNNIRNKEIFMDDEFDQIIEYDEIISSKINSFISSESDMNIYTDNDNYTEIRILSAGTNSQIIGKSLNELNLSKSTKIIAIISSSGNISHNFSDTINPLDKILLQVSMNN
ncbi:MAG: NAD-binding protein [Dehalococcoidia bacterium]|nr:NAD-binding protein [Dehalococcoidia bacterium]